MKRNRIMIPDCRLNARPTAKFWFLGDHQFNNPPTIGICLKTPFNGLKCFY